VAGGGQGSVDRNLGGDAETVEDDALQSGADDEIERVALLGKQAQRRGSRGLDEAQRLTEDEVLVLGEHLGRHVDEQAELPESLLLLPECVFTVHHKETTRRWAMPFPEATPRSSIGAPPDQRTPGGAVSDALLAVAMTAAQLGGAVLRSYFGRLGAGEVEEKSQHDWVSAADRESEEAIASFLRRQTPEYGLLAEEGGQRASGSAVWVVDPLDGTANFVRSFPHFAVSVGLLVEGEASVGAVYDPMRDELFAAAAGQGAFRNGRRIAVSARGSLDGGFVTTGFPFRVQRHIDTYLEIFRAVYMRAMAIRRPGAAALDLAHTAAGIFDGFFEFNLSPWDLVAGTLIVREAGGVVSNLDGGEDVLSRGNVIAATPGVHRDLLEIVQRTCREDAIR
jgi:myo-inositol-1(or 4)-monophosphatase